MKADYIYLAEVTAKVDASTTTVLRFCTGTGYRTKPSETPASVRYQARIVQPALMRRDAFDAATTFGSSKVGYGELVLNNADGVLDPLIDYGFDGQEVVIRIGRSNAAFPSGFTTILVGTMEQPEFDRRRVSIKIRDRQAELDRALMPARFLGTNSGATGIEGLADDLRGSTPPALWGSVENVTPVLLNASKKIFGLNFVGALSRSSVVIGTGNKTFVLDRDVPFVAGKYARAAFDQSNYVVGTVDSYTAATKTLVLNAVTAVGTGTKTTWEVLGTKAVAAITPVKDRGSNLTASGTDRADLSALQGATISAGEYDTCLAEGLLRLGGTNFYALTANVLEGANAAARTAAQIGKKILTENGAIPTADLSSADVTALDSANSAVIGLSLGNGESCKDALDLAIGSVGAYWGPDSTGVFRLARLELPSGTPVAKFIDKQIVSIQRLPNNDPGRGVPPYRVNVNYRFNHTVLDPLSLLNTAADAFAAFAGAEYRTETASDPAVLDIHTSQVELTFNTRLTDATDAATEAARLLTLHKTRRDRFNIRVGMNPDVAAAIQIGSVVQIKMDRFGLGSGKLFRVLGLQIDLRTGLVDMTIWG